MEYEDEVIFEELNQLGEIEELKKKLNLVKERLRLEKHENEMLREKLSERNETLVKLSESLLCKTEELQSYKKYGLEPCDYAGIIASDNKAKQAQQDLSKLIKECSKLNSENKRMLGVLSGHCCLCKFQEDCAKHDNNDAAPTRRCVRLWLD